MNIKALTLSIISVAAAVAASSAPAQAQEERRPPSARWEFAPNTWRKETIQMPRGYNAPAPAVAVRSGSVPSASNIFGDKSYITKAPPAPMPAPLVRVNQAVSAVPIAKSNSPLEAFKAAFGKPISAAPPMVAALPQGLPAAPPAALPSAARNVSAHRLPSRRPSVSTNTAIKMLPKRSAPAAIANYGSLGFTPVHTLQLLEVAPTPAQLLTAESSDANT